MYGEAHWFPVVVVLAGGLSLFLLWLLRKHSDRHLQTKRQRLVCPKTGQPVECVLVRDTIACRWTGVMSCTAFAQPEDVSCQRYCIQALNALA